MVASENEQTDPSPEEAIAAEVGESTEDPAEDAVPVVTTEADKPWFRRPGTLAVVGLLAAALIAALVFVVGRDSSTSSGGAAMTIPEYFSANGITATPVRRGEPGTPVVSFTLPRGWSDAGGDAPEGSYGAAFYDSSPDLDYPPSVVALLTKLEGNADPAKILEYAPGELEALPDYTVVSKPKPSTMSGFEAVQLGGLYTREDGAERIVAQKTVVIPAQDGLYVLQLNVDAPKDEAAVLQEATAALDDQAKIAP